MLLRRALTLHLVVAVQLSLCAIFATSSKDVFVPEQGRHLLDASADADTSASFLSELPLTVVSTTPSYLITPSLDPVPISKYETIQVVYSRAVIPLGANVSDMAAFTIGDDSVGRFRWINSYIARFDPVGGDWGDDLSLKLTWNRDLLSWDGAHIEGLDKLKVR
jgi:hypothetical protein